MNMNSRRCARCRSGFLLHETMTALVILATVMAGAGQMINMVVQQRRTAEYRALAALEVANVMEELAARDWPQLAEEPPQIELTSHCRGRLPDPQVRIEITPDDEAPGARRIRVALDWQTPQGARSRPVSLVAWRFQTGEVRP